MKLYKLAENYRNLLDLMDNQEIPQEMIIEALNEVSESIENKAIGIVKLIKNYEVESAVIREEEKRLADRRRSLEKKIESVKEYLKANMQVTGLKNIKNELFTISIQKNPASVNIKDESMIPNGYLIPQPPEVDKKRLLADLKTGAVIDGCELIQGESLRVR